MKRSVRRLTILIFSFVFLLSVVVLVIARSYLDPFVKNALQNGVKDNSNGLYQLSIQKLRINLLSGTVRMYGISLQTDTVRLAAIRNGHVKRPAKMMFTADFAGIYHIHWWKYWKTGALAITEIELESPVVEIATVKDSLTVKDSTAALLDRLPGLVAPLAKSIVIRQIHVHEARLLVQTEKSGRLTLQSAGQIQLSLTNTRLDPQDSSDHDRTLYSDDFLLKWQNYRLWTVGERYLFQIGKGALMGQTLDIQDCTLRSVGSDSITVAEPPFRRPRFNFDLPHLSAKGLDVFRAIHHGDIRLRHLEIDKGVVNVFNNMNLPAAHWRKLPNEAWQTIQLHVSIDSLTATGTDIYCTEQVKEEQSTFSFLHTRVLALNISNDPALMTDTTPARINATTQFMGAGDLSVSMGIPLLAPNFFCSFQAVLRDMPLTRLNALLKNKNNLRIDEGFASEITVTGQSTSRWTKGLLKIYYKDLKVSVLKDDSTEKKQIVSAVANLVVRNNSEDPKEDLPFRSEPIDYQREAEDSFLRMIVRAAQGALVKSITALNIKPKKK